MFLQNKGIELDHFYLPPFELHGGEIIVINPWGGAHFYKTSMFLKDFFCGKIKHENIIIYKKLTFVEHFFEPALRYYFYPITVGEYLKKNAAFESPYATKIYETEWIHKKTKVNTLAGNPRGLLRMYATLSKTNDILFDLVGQDPQGAQITYGIVKQMVQQGGAAILLDNNDDLKNDCTKYIELQCNVS